MVGLAIFTTLMAIFVVGPLAIRAWQERMQARGLAIRAEIDAALRHELHGESLLGVQVVPEAPWRTGRVEVSAPILERMPAGYELVVQHPGPAPLRAAA